MLTSIMKTQEKGRHEAALYLALAALAFCTHLYIVFRYTQNIPVGDDYTDALRFLYNYVNANAWHEKLMFFYAQHNEHRTTINRIIYVLMYWVNGGSLNFKALMIIGDLSTIGMVALFSLKFRKEQYFPFMLALAAIFVFNLQSWHSMIMAMTAISNYSVAFFAFAALCALTSNRNNSIPLAVTFAFCSAFSQGNGVLVWPVGLVFLASEPTDNRRRNLIVWSAAMLACIALYFFDYTRPNTISSLHHLISSTEAWGKLITWFLTFIGSCWAFESNNAAIATVAGAMICLALAPSFLFLRRRAPNLAYFLLFVVLSAATASYSRFTFFDLIFAMSSRYRIYSVYISCILLIALYLRLAEVNANWKLIKASVLSIALLHTVISYASSMGLLRSESRDAADATRALLLMDKKLFGYVFIPDTDRIADKAIRAHIWRPQSLFTDSLDLQRTRHSTVCTDTIPESEIPMAIDHVKKAPIGELFIRDTLPSREHITGIFVCTKNRTYVDDFPRPSRTADGQLRFRFVATGPMKAYERVIIQLTSGKLLVGIPVKSPDTTQQCTQTKPN